MAVILIKSVIFQCCYSQGHLLQERINFQRIDNNFFSSQGYFSHTLMYYGYYSNFTLNAPDANNTHYRQHMSSQMSYNMPLAYLFVTGSAFFGTCFLLIYR